MVRTITYPSTSHYFSNTITGRFHTNPNTPPRIKQFLFHGLILHHCKLKPKKSIIMLIQKYCQNMRHTIFILTHLATLDNRQTVIYQEFTTNHLADISENRVHGSHQSFRWNSPIVVVRLTVHVHFNLVLSPRDS